MLTMFNTDDGTITIKEYDASYADECAPLINNISEFGNPAPLIRTKE